MTTAKHGPIPSAPMLASKVMFAGCAVARHSPVGPLASLGTCPESHHRGVRPALIHEHQAPGVELARSRQRARPPHRAWPLRAASFERQAQPREGATHGGGRDPQASSNSSQCSAKVRSGLAPAWAGSAASSAAPFRAGGPGTGLGSTTPVSLPSLT